MSENELNKRGRQGIEEMRMRNREVDMQEIVESIEKAKYCSIYKNIRVVRLLEYIRIAKRREGKKVCLIARMRCGNETRASCYWREREWRMCRVCAEKCEREYHIARNCVKIERWNGRIENLLNEDGRGYD